MLSWQGEQLLDNRLGHVHSWLYLAMKGAELCTGKTYSCTNLIVRLNSTDIGPENKLPASKTGRAPLIDLVARRNKKGWQTEADLQKCFLREWKR